ncbi:MAG TPA: phytanoyl-CoA dioxygenase family protein [Acidimicrobiales bacterium]|nr:phytanoyl-CoA dioxygenase family protein [Acidimicrobiales bacterium]
MSTPQPHPWNRDFAWRDHDPGRATALAPGEVEQFDRDGFVVVPELLAPSEVAAALAAIDELAAASEAALRDRPGGRLSISEAGAITFTTHLVTRSAVARRLSAHPRIVALARDLVGDDVRLYWDQAVYKFPERPRRFPWHQDNGYSFVEPQEYLTVWLALTDARLANGCPQVARGLHRLGTLRHRFVDPLGYECLGEVADPAVAEVPAGGAVVFSSLTPHLTGPNTTGAVRKAYILQYAPSGATVLGGDPRGEPKERLPCDDPERQYEVLRGGRAVPPPPLSAGPG